MKSEIMQEKKINRSNSFVVNALKWWPIHNNNNNNNNNNNGIKAFGSTVAVQKLRESKWFSPDEQRIFCAVVECGFIVEIRDDIILESTTTTNGINNIHNNIDDEDDDDDYIITDHLNGFNSENNFDKYHDLQQQQDVKNSWYGIVICKTGKDNKPKPDTIEIFSVKIRENGVRVFKMSLIDIWKRNWKIRINNFADREKHPHNEKDIKNQVSFARKAKYSLWHNTKHFAYWCRYGSRQQDIRKRQMSECVKWGSVGMNAGMMLIMNNKPKSYSASK